MTTNADQTAQHTPGPWDWDRDLYRPQDGVIRSRQGQPVCRVARTNQEANAEFIIRACNAYECDQAVIKKLLSAAQQVEAWLTSGIRFHGNHGEETAEFPVQWLRAAIQKATGGESHGSQ